jgi:Tol biopolymer transport system component
MKRIIPLTLLAFTIGMVAGPTTAPAQTVARIVFEAPVTVQTSKHSSTTYGQILSMNPDGSGVVQLTRTSATSQRPKWSPGQAYIAFCRAGHLWVMPAQGEANGGQSFAVAPTGGGGADWSTDGSTLVFQGTDGGLHLVGVNPGAGTAGMPVLLRSGYWYNPSWSPDGTKIAANGSDDGNSDIIAVFNAATGAELATYAGSSNPSLYPCFAPQWNPEGSYLAFSGPVFVTTISKRGVKTTTFSSQEILLATPDLSVVTRLTHLDSFSNFPTWSPDGSTLAFNSGNSICTMPLGSSTVTLLHTPGTQPDWNP